MGLTVFSIIVIFMASRRWIWVSEGITVATLTAAFLSQLITQLTYKENAFRQVNVIVLAHEFHVASSVLLYLYFPYDYKVSTMIRLPMMSVGLWNTAIMYQLKHDASIDPLGLLGVAVGFIPIMELFYYKQSKTISMLFFQGQKSEQEQQQT